MNKIIAVLLVAIICIFLMACSDTVEEGRTVQTEKTAEITAALANNSKKSVEAQVPGPESTSKNVENTPKIGEILDTPELYIETDDVKQAYFLLTISDDTAVNGASSMELAIKMAKNGTYVMYMSDGVQRTYERVLTLTKDNVLEAYTRDSFSEKFVIDTSSTQEDLQADEAAFWSLLYTLGFDNGAYNDYKFKKCEDSTASFVGDVYVYELISNNEKIGVVNVDKATGVYTLLKDANENHLFIVEEMNFTNVDIPKYK